MAGHAGVTRAWVTDTGVLGELIGGILCFPFSLNLGPGLDLIVRS